MARDKEKSVNPATAHLKAQKSRQLKKGRAEALTRRNEKLARRNPERLQRQIDDLKALEANGSIKPREKEILAELERDVKAIRKARENLGDKAPSFGGGSRGPRDGSDRRGGETGKNQHLGKRNRDGSFKSRQHSARDASTSSGSETDESVRRIPMPRDTPPPIPRPRRRSRSPPPAGNSSHPLPSKPPSTAPAQTTYSSAPQIRDLKKEAVSRFVPAAVRQKTEAVRGQGKLVEPEEMDRLEKSGYGLPATRGNEVNKDTLAAETMEAGSEAARLAEEEERFRREVEIDGGSVEGAVDRNAAAAETMAAGVKAADLAEDEEKYLREMDTSMRQEKQVEIEEVEDEDL
ncbi:MAG: hypothetical protein Q9227_008832 [Pyrenula ochraceoflavens]